MKTLRQALARAMSAALVCLAVLALLPAACMAQQYELTAQVQPQSVQVGDTVIYLLEVRYQGKVPPRPMLMPFAPSYGFSQPQELPPSSKHEIRTDMSGTVQIASITYAYQFTVSKEGAFTIPGTGFDVDGQKYRSNPVTLTVGRAPQIANLPSELVGKVAPPHVPGNPKLQNALNSVVFVLPAIQTTTPYNGQQVLLNYHLCIDQEGLNKAGVRGERMMSDQVELPEFKQFVKEEVYPIPNRLEFREQTFGNKKYAVAPLYQVAITPTKTGTLEIEPFRLALRLPSRQRSNDPFGMMGGLNEPFFGDMGMDMMFGHAVRVIAQSPRLQLDVRPLPEAGKPGEFTGVVGEEFRITASIDKTTLKANDDIAKLTVAIEGRGNAASIRKPIPAPPEGLTFLEEPQSNVKSREENNDLVSLKTFDYLVRANRPGKVAVPPITLAYFNPTAGKYDVAKSPPLSIDVQPGSQPQQPLVAGPAASPPGTGAAQPSPAAERPREINEDINYIHAVALALHEPGTLDGRGAAFVFLVAAPPLLVLGAWLIGRRRMAVEANLGHYRAIAAGYVARKHLRKAARLLPEQGAFYTELARAIRGYFGDKLRIDTASLTSERIEEELKARNVADDEIGLVLGFLDQCDLARYGSGAARLEETQQAYANAARLLDRMEKAL